MIIEESVNKIYVKTHRILNGLIYSSQPQTAVILRLTFDRFDSLFYLIYCVTLRYLRALLNSLDIYVHFVIYVDGKIITHNNHVHRINETQLYDRLCIGITQIKILLVLIRLCSK